MHADSCGATVRALRKAKGWNQSELAVRAGRIRKRGMDKSMISRLEADGNVELDTLRAVAQALEVSVAHLFAPAQGRGMGVAEHDMAQVASGSEIGHDVALAAVPKPPANLSPEERALPHRVVPFILGHLGVALGTMTPEVQRRTIHAIRTGLDALASGAGEAEERAVRVNHVGHS